MVTMIPLLYSKIPAPPLGRSPKGEVQNSSDQDQDGLLSEPYKCRQKNVRRKHMKGQMIDKEALLKMAARGDEKKLSLTWEVEDRTPMVGNAATILETVLDTVAEGDYMESEIWEMAYISHRG